MLAYLCEARTYIWHNTRTLWQDVVKKYPATIDTVYDEKLKQHVVHTHEGVETAYKNLGNYYAQDIKPPNYDSAYMNYEVLEKINSKDAGVYANLGNIWAIRGNMKKSLDEYTKSLKLDSNSFDTYLNRAITYANMGRNDLSILDYNRAHKIDSNNQSLYVNRAYMYLNGIRDYRDALADFNHLLSIDPNNPEYFRGRGFAELNLGMNNDAISDLNKALAANAKDKEALFFMSLVYKNLKSYPEALSYAQKAQENGYKVPQGTIEELQKLAKSGS
jgi:tetratricopeptide (TPR) repeat protein